jgi:cytochrome b pre-mRNA-processing protein 3
VISTWIKRALGVKMAGDPRPAAQAVFEASRTPGFYIDLGVPDTFDGRFEALALHLHLLLVRLRREGETGAAFSQGVFDVVTGHFDEALREIGVGDMSVGKRAKAMTRGLYGRLSAYNAGFNADTAAEMRDALRRNLYGTVEEAREEWIDAVIAYQAAAAAHLAAMPLAAIQEGRNLFPALEVRK